MSSSGGPSGWLKLASRASPAAAAAHTDVELAHRQPAQPLGIPHTQPLQATTHQQHTECGSSGTGLPSALATPPGCTRTKEDDVSSTPAAATASPTSCSQTEEQEEPQEQEQQQQSLRRQSKASVSWLPGLEAPPAASGVEASAAVDAPAAGRVLAGGTAAAGKASAHGSSSSRLPASDDPQLDRYLSYLLTGEHSHRFMHYPSWGLTDSGCAALGAFLARDKRIKVMSLTDNSITDDGVELIAEGLADNSTLLSLDLSSNLVTCAGAIELAEALHSDKCRLAELRLANNRIGDEGADALAAAVAGCRSLKKLVLSGNPAISVRQLEVVEACLTTREYKLPAARPAAAATSSSKQGKRHMRKCSSGLQFALDIELTEGQQGRTSSSNNLRQRDLPTPQAVAALVEPKDMLESSIAMQAAQLLTELQPGADQQDSLSLALRLAIRLSCRGYDVVLRTCSPATTWQQHQPPPPQQQQQQQATTTPLRHTFLRVTQPLPADELLVELPTVIVDPRFQDQFLLPHATPRLQEALEALPRVLVLSEPRLWHLVELLCSQTGAPAVIVDSWLSKRFHDIAVDAESCVEGLRQALLEKQN